MSSVMTVRLSALVPPRRATRSYFSELRVVIVKDSSKSWESEEDILDGSWWRVLGRVG